MKSVNLLFCSFLFVIIGLISVSCSKDTNKNTTDAYYEALLSAKMEAFTLLNSEGESFVNPSTKSDLVIMTEEELPDFLEKYIQMWTESEDFFRWDERLLCSELTNDTELTYEQKMNVVKVIGYATNCKDFAMSYGSTITKSNSDKCLQIYKKAVKSILMKCIVNIACCIPGGLLGVEAGAVCNLFAANEDIKVAGSEYLKCCS